ncbi:MAG: hypothetical protein JNL06_12980 [Alphaproteobacteria bacterium]|nr:hypothetical protein [Alphaproteobacteria bacterium]
MPIAAQAGPRLAVGPDAGGYLCPDGRQLYVKSCYDESPGASCGIVNMHLPLRNGYQVETRNTRSEITPSVAACKVYPLEFKDGIVTLVAPTPKISARGAGDKTSVVDGIAIGTSNVKSSLLRLPTAAGTMTYFVDESSRRTTDQNDTAAIWVLTVWPKGSPAFPKRTRGVWSEYSINCTQHTYEAKDRIALDKTAKVLGGMTSGSRSTVAKGTVGDAIAQVACSSSHELPWPRLPNAAAAIATVANTSIAAKVSCPAFKVTGTVGSGDVVFSVKPAPDGLTYNWSVSAGTIISGQNSKSITVFPGDLPSGTIIAASLEIRGLDPSCKSVVSAEAKLP